MEKWQFRPLGKTSAVSGVDFKTGERVKSVLFKPDEETVQRVDLRDEEWAAFQSPTKVLGHWTQMIQERRGSEKRSPHQALQIAEERFLALYEMSKEPQTAPDEQTRLLKHLLALILERKRRLRLLDFEKERCRYLHVKSKVVYEVPLVAINRQCFEIMREELTSVIQSVFLTL